MEYIPVTPKKEKRRLLTYEEKEKIAQHIEKKINRHKRILLDPLMASGVEWSKEEIKHQNISLYGNEETIEQEVKIEQPNLRLRKEVINLLCLHKNTEEQNGYIVCTKCNAKWKVKSNG